MSCRMYGDGFREMIALIFSRSGHSSGQLIQVIVANTTSLFIPRDKSTLTKACQCSSVGSIIFLTFNAKSFILAKFYFTYNNYLSLILSLCQLF